MVVTFIKIFFDINTAIFHIHCVVIKQSKNLRELDIHTS